MPGNCLTVSETPRLSVFISGFLSDLLFIHNFYLLLRDLFELLLRRELLFFFLAVAFPRFAEAARPFRADERPLFATQRLRE